MLALVAVSYPALAQFIPPPRFPPPAQQQQPNPANPNQKVQIPRQNAPGPNDLLIDADEKEEVEGSMRHMRGHVRLETIDMLLLADELDYNEETADAQVRGNVKFLHFLNGDRIECDHADYNLNDETGKFYGVRGTSPTKIESRPGVLTTSNPFYFEGAWAQRIHEKYILYNGWITDCRVPKPWWRLTGPKFDIIPGDRAIAYHSWFRLRYLPLFYAPAYYKSLKKEPRKSGFLTPNIGHSSTRGFMFGGGYFWAINRSYDAMYRLQYFTERGPAHTVDLRGKVRPGTDFNVSMYAVQDRGIQIGTNPDGSALLQKQGGVQAEFQARSDLGGGWTGRMDVNYLSSYLFRQAFSESFHEAIFSESRSVGFVTKHWSSYAIDIDADRDEQFLTTAPQTTVTIRKMPEVAFLSREHEIDNPVLPLWFSFESSAALLHRAEPDYQSGQFVNRLDIAPRVTTAFHWAGFSLVPSFSARETRYSETLDSNGAPAGKDFLRSTREVDVQLIAPSLERIYKAPKWLGDKMKHVIEARADYRYVGGIGNYVTTNANGATEVQSDFNRVLRFDETDLLSDTNEVTFMVANRLYVKGTDGNVNQVLSWEVSQARYFDPSFGGAVVAGQRNIVQSEEDLTGFAFLDGPRNYSPIVSVLRVQQRFGMEWRVDYDPLRKTVVNSGFSTDVRWSKYFVSLGEYQIKTDPILTPTSNQFRGLVGFGNQTRKGWNGAFTSYYDVKRGLVQYSTAEITYNTDCCGISVEYRRFNIGIRDDTQYRVAFAVSNVGSFGTLKKQERIF